MTAVIIDDMPQAIQSLKTDLLSYCPQVNVIGEADGVVNGAKLLRKISPDILFLDIQLGDGSGFDLLEILPKIDFKLIFTTASDAFAIKAFRFAAIDYLLKPIDPEDLEAAVSRASMRLTEQNKRLDLLTENLQSNQAPTRIALHTQEKIQIVEISNIIRCASTGNYTHFFFREGKKLLVTKTLKEFDKLLSENRFIRVHQSHLINLEQIEAFIKTEGGYILMKDGSRIPVSTRKRPIVLKMLDSL